MSMGGGTSHTTTTQELSPEQRALIAPVIPIAQNFLANPPKQWQGSGIVPFTDLQKQAQQMTINAANKMNPMMQQTGKQFNQLFGDMTTGVNANLAGLKKGTNFLTSGDVLKAESNPYLQGAISAATRPVMENFQQQILPNLTQGAVSAGGFGGTRQGIAEGLAGKEALAQVGDISSSMSNANYQAGLQAMLGGLSEARGQAQLDLAGSQAAQQLLGSKGQIMSQTLLPAQLKEQVGNQQYAMKQAQLSEQIQKYINQQMIPFAAAQDVAAMAFGMPGGTTKSSSTQPGNPMGGLQAGVGLLSALPALFAKSERKVKYAIRTIKTLVDGLRLYAYRYVGDIHDKIGLMAEEVELLYPEAVRVEADGYKRVNYLAIPTFVGSY